MFKRIHTLISSLPYWWPWMYDDPWFIVAEENTVPLRVPERSSDNLSWSGQPELPEIDMYSTYQPINSSHSSSRKPTMNQGEESYFSPRHAHFDISVKVALHRQAPATQQGAGQPQKPAGYPEHTREAVNHTTHNQESAQCSLWIQDTLDYPHIEFFEKYLSCAWTNTAVKLCSCS